MGAGPPPPLPGGAPTGGNNLVPQSVMYQQLPDGQVQVIKFPTGTVPVLLTSSTNEIVDKQQLYLPQQQQPQQQLYQETSRRNSQDSEEVQRTVLASSQHNPQTVPAPALQVEQQCGHCKQTMSSLNVLEQVGLAPAGSGTGNPEPAALPVPQNTPVREPSTLTPSEALVVQQHPGIPLESTEIGVDPSMPSCLNTNCQASAVTSTESNVSCVPSPGTTTLATTTTTNIPHEPPINTSTPSFFELSNNSSSSSSSFRYLTTPVKVVSSSTGQLADALIRTPVPVTTPSNPYPNQATSYIPGQSMPHHIPAGNAQQQQVASNASRLINQLINQANSKRKHSLPLTTAAGAAGLVVSMAEAGGLAASATSQPPESGGLHHQPEASVGLTRGQNEALMRRGSLPVQPLIPGRGLLGSFEPSLQHGPITEHALGAILQTTSSVAQVKRRSSTDSQNTVAAAELEPGNQEVTLSQNTHCSYTVDSYFLHSS